METERIALSQRERDRLHVLHDAQQGRLTQVAAAQRMKLSERQVRRLLQRLREEGDRVVIHGLRGRPSNRKLDVSFERKVLTRVGQRYADFGPTAGGGALSPGWVTAEPGDPAEMDDQSGVLASALPTGEKDPRVARAPRQLRGAGDAGQLSVSLAGGSRSGLPTDRHD